MAIKSILVGYPEIIPVGLHKDVGSIPLTLSRDFSLRADLICWKSNHASNTSYPDRFHSYVSYLPLAISSFAISRQLALFRYLLANSRKYDIFLCYHLKSESLLALLLFKLLSPASTTVLKLDIDSRALPFFTGDRTLKQKLLWLLLFITPIDLLTVESQAIYDLIGPHIHSIRKKVELFPLGSDLQSCQSPTKERIVLTVGRLGTFQKHNEMLLEAINALPYDLIKDWNFVFVGSRTPEFDRAILKIITLRPELQDVIVVLDELASRHKLAELYARSSIFALTSRWESAAIVLLEAAQHGCYIVSSAVGMAPEITQHGRLGSLFEPDDLNGLVSSLHAAIANHHHHPRRLITENASNFRWNVVCRNFLSALIRISDSRMK